MVSFSKYFAVGVIAASSLFAVSGVAQAATVSGEECGNKYIALTQGDTELVADMCTGRTTSEQNSTGSNSPIADAGWIDSAEIDKDSGPSGSGPLQLAIDQEDNTWSIANLFGYSMVGISLKQGNGFAFYILDTTMPLSGFWFTGNGVKPKGNDYSHFNAWYKGDPVTPPSTVPLPASGLLLIGGLGGFAALRRRRKAARA